MRYWRDEPVESWQPAPSRLKRLLIITVVVIVVVVALIGGAMVLTRGSGTAEPTQSSTASATATPTRTPTREPSQYEVRSPGSVDLAVYGHLSKGDCFGDLPDLDNALVTTITVETVACAQPHKSQVVGYATIEDIPRSEGEATRASIYAERCVSLMQAGGVPEALFSLSEPYWPSGAELDAGAKTILCLVTTDKGGSGKQWTGSVLDGTATGF